MFRELSTGVRHFGRILAVNSRLRPPKGEENRHVGPGESVAADLLTNQLMDTRLKTITRLVALRVDGFRLTIYGQSTAFESPVLLTEEGGPPEWMTLIFCGAIRHRAFEAEIVGQDTWVLGTGEEEEQDHG